jgi:hypothetical protein
MLNNKEVVIIGHMDVIYMEIIIEIKLKKYSDHLLKNKIILKLFYKYNQWQVEQALG